MMNVTICVFFLILLVQSQLVILSPDTLRNKESILFQGAFFGQPSFIPSFGKLYFLGQNTTCSVPQPLPPYSIAVSTQIDENCAVSDFALSIQNAGGVGFILVSDNIISIYPTTVSQGLLVNIFVISIFKVLFLDVLQQTNLNIWVAINTQVNNFNIDTLYYYMGTNYELNLLFLNEIIQLNQVANLQVENFDILMTYVNGEPGTDILTDCLESDYRLYCEASINGTSGQDLLRNSIQVINLYNSLGPRTYISEFLTWLQGLFTQCKQDQSASCVNTYFESSHQQTNASTSALLSAISSSIPNYYLLHSGFAVYSPNFFQTSYCILSGGKSAYCDLCGNTCQYSDLFSSTCDPSCNISSCAYQALKCLEISPGCFSFMLGDGNCNSECANDPDCLKGQCSVGCFYSQMSAGQCPLACQGSCFENCSPQYCSPQCLYSDLNAGNCSSLCTSQCLNNCSTNFCSPGCKFSDLYIGNCNNCNSQCMQLCKCDPKCTANDPCPSECNVYCCQNSESKSSSNSSKFIIISVVTVVGTLL